MKNFNYGVIGNCTSAALVSEQGSIDWACLPDFDSYSVFGRILDKKQGGYFAVKPIGPYSVSQEYVEDTNVLVTLYSSGKDQFEIYDFMPRSCDAAGDYHCPPDIVRYIRHVKGKPRIRIDYQPRLCYGSGTTVTEVKSKYIKSYSTEGPYESVYLYSDIEYKAITQRKAVVLTKDHFLRVCYNQKIFTPTCKRAYLELEKTKVYWLNWSAKTKQFSQYTREITRCVLVLKILTFQKSGAIIAAVTTSLPEVIGGVRNWDYRFCWLRDASMMINILTTLGHFNAARRYLHFILDVIPYKDEKVQIMYGIKGEKKLTEKLLTHLCGYENSQPVRIGNKAYIQKQNDVYGVVVDAIYQSMVKFKQTVEFSEDIWTVVRTLVRNVERNWQKPDRGIWELRNKKGHFVFSKILCWVAADRGIKIAEFLEKDTYAREWSKLRDAIHEDIYSRGWNPRVKAFVQSYGSDDLDAANLQMEPYGFIDADDPKWISTVERTYEELCCDGLMFRYRNEDDFGAPSSSFTICTFWMIKSLYKIGRHEEAQKLFKKVLTYANHVGLFSEDIHFKSKVLLGNFPQGYSHLALADTAMTLAGDGQRDRQRLRNLFLE